MSLGMQGSGGPANLAGKQELAKVMGGDRSVPDRGKGVCEGPVGAEGGTVSTLRVGVGKERTES